MLIAKDVKEDKALSNAFQQLFIHKASVDIRVGYEGTVVWVSNRRGEVVVRVRSVDIEHERAAVFDEFPPPLNSVEITLIAIARFLELVNKTK